MIYITSQDYLNDEIVNAKKAAGDFEVLVSPLFDFEGVMVSVVLDGHHSLAAAIEAGEEPVFVEANATDHDAISLLDGTADGVAAFTESTWMGSDYRNAVDGSSVW